jgi:hypothetical protein
MLRTTLVIAILIPGLAAAFYDRFAAFLMYVWLALFRPQDWVWIDITSLRPSLVFFIDQRLYLTAAVSLVPAWSGALARGQARS